MVDERNLIAQLESADTDELAQIILQASSEEEQVMRIYLGNQCYQSLRSLTLRREMVTSGRGNQQMGNVVVIPGILGSELSSFDKARKQERIWLNPRRIIDGQMARLHLDIDGLHEVDPRYMVKATGIMKRYYGQLLLTLARNWHVHAFWYDWRKDLRLAAADLQARINSWFGEDAIVHIVAHSVGGLVARAYIQQYPTSWARGGRLIMLGTPNFGTYTATQGIVGQIDLVRWIDLLDIHHDLAQARAVVHSFPALYQLLPFAADVQDEQALYRAETYGPDLKVPQTYLDNAQKFHQMLQKQMVDPERMIYIAGYNQPTFVRLKNVNQVKHLLTPDNIWDAYEIGWDGDGSVPHELGRFGTTEKPQIPTYYVAAKHGDLHAQPQVLMTLDELLTQPLGNEQWRQIGISSGLQTTLPREAPTGRDPAKELKAAWDKDNEALEQLVRRVHIRSGEAVERAYFTPEERAIEEILTRHFLLSQHGMSGQAAATPPLPFAVPFKPPTLTFHVVQGNIAHLALADMAGGQVDAIAIGHYSGGRPQGALRELDLVISQEINKKKYKANPDQDLLESNLLLTQCAQRGVIRGDLAELFFVDDPRHPGRVIAVVGMGVPGRFGVPEVTVLVRELGWTLGHIGKRHLATVLIGAGRNNLSVADAVSGWVRGLKNALTGIMEEEWALADLTFVEEDPAKVIEIDQALTRERDAMGSRNRMIIAYKSLKANEIKVLQTKAADYQAAAWQRQPVEAGELEPTRITVSLEGHTYRFGALTNVASIPERAIPLDPKLVSQANNELAAEIEPVRQFQLGQFMERLLIPTDLRNQLISTAPLVMMLDATTARIHWELMAQSDGVYTQSPDAEPYPKDERLDRFLGTCRGFTRQLRTMFALPPEPPPAERRILRVLVVADPAEDAHLTGAEEEGIVVADLFESFNIVHAASQNRVEVIRLFGPREATRTAVLRELMLRSYDVLHFAGHCKYDKADPPASGWIFSKGERLSAYEFNRIDRVPKFIFSNACESGITPDRVGKRSVELAPSLAEAFFARGVSNFVCTAWPVDDRAARDFALTLYAGLLGLTHDNGDASEPKSYRAGPLKPMHVAMRDARRAIAEPPNDIRTWGAYQHYGNPYFRFFDPVTMGVGVGKEDKQISLQAMAKDLQVNGDGSNEGEQTPTPKTSKRKVISATMVGESA